MFKSILNKVAENVVVGIGKGIQATGKAVEQLPSEMAIVSKSATLCFKVGQLEGSKVAIENHKVISEMDRQIQLINNELKGVKATYKSIV